MKYDFNSIEEKWQKYWAKNQTFKAENPKSNLSSPPSEGPGEAFYCLDMFPYPSGAGLHVGHPLGYIASDIVSRYKRHKGFNVLHPMGYDSFGLPAEQYAIQTGQHPAITTKENIARYRQQMDKIGFSFDWSREVRTSDPNYYKWTQWIFIQLFESWYDKSEDKARNIKELGSIFSEEGNANVNAACDNDIETFSAEEWNAFSEKEQQEILLKYRLTYLAETEVNWCPALGTVLANDEIVNGVSERGGHPVEKKKMKQWSMRISAYAERLLQGLEKIDWSESLKETQRNWIGKSVGAEINFPILTFPKEEGTPKPGYMTGGNNSHLLLKRAKEMRNQPTQAEGVLWEFLRSKKLGGHKFRRQHLIDDFIVDFVCLRKKLIIEVDGKIHDTTLEYDEARTKILNGQNFKVIRFKNEEVISNIDSVLERINQELERTVPPSGARGSQVPPSGVRGISVFTTRPDTIFGATFMTLAPEHELVSKITTTEQKEAVEAYIKKTAKRSERDRMADVKTISGVFTGAYAEHPFTKKAIPIWIGDYVLAGYGTGAVMAVPSGDQRDYDFAKYFDIPIKNIFENVDISEEAYADKEAETKLTNSNFLNGLTYKDAVKKVIFELEKTNQGTGKTNYRLRDAVFSRQRYWGEPFPIYYKNGVPHTIPEDCLPLKLPEVEKYLPTETGEPPLGRATEWHWDEKNKKVVPPPAPPKGGRESTPPPSEGAGGRIELNTMPGWAGSSWYFFRYMEKEKRNEVFASKEAMDYWQNVDLYLGGSEHGTGHLLYSRFWVKFLYDRGLVPIEEPFKKLINQGMILGESAFVYRFDPVFLVGSNYAEENKHSFEKLLNKIPSIFLLKEYIDIQYEIENKANFENGKFEELKQIIHTYNSENLELNILSLKFTPIHVDVSFVNIHNELNIEAFKNWRPEFKDAKFITEEDGKFIVHREVEKMSKSKYNVVNPDDICEDYGADTLRMYEMFLGPLEQAKPWNTAGITGVHGFLKKLWKLYHSPSNSPKGGESKFFVSEEKASSENLKVLHKTIKKVTEDIENFSFNTSISSLMICVNELSSQKCNSREVLEPLAILISPFAPHIAEELWEKLGHSKSISTVGFPVYEEKYVVENTKKYPVSFNGKMRFTMDLPLNLSKEEIEKTVMNDNRTQKQLDGKTPKKIIIVPGKIVNIVA